MINLFIDTNIFLNFFSFSDDDLDKLSNLHELINKTHRIKLFVPSQIVREFRRNRELKIRDAMERFKNSNNRAEIPRICSEIKEIRTLSNVLFEKKQKLIEKINEAVKSKTLKADLLINDLFTSHTKVKIEVFKMVNFRINVGNPPGKNGSKGDAINWEFLLSEIPDKEDLYFVSDDIDYKSPLDENSLSLFLKEEWEEKKSSKIHYYKNLNSFFKDKFPEINLKDDYIIDIKIQEFAESPSFDIARERLRELKTLGEFSDSQVQAIINASISNDQIYNAHEYSPFVGKYLKDILAGHEDKIEKGALMIFNEYFNTAEDL